jgi:hypothetical protein
MTYLLKDFLMIKNRDLIVIMKILNIMSKILNFTKICKNMVVTTIVIRAVKIFNLIKICNTYLKMIMKNFFNKKFIHNFYFFK